jgi:glycosyltransferase involved in cell wall biosynthesis
MSPAPSPLVSILTPVYNGADHLAECIESVLAQTYPNWDYTIVDNCSTDRSLAIAQKYAAQDRRICVVSNHRFLNILENHNHTIRQISQEAKYCKFVFADDWLYPNCIQEMVSIAARSPSIGLVGAYTMDGRAVRWHGPPYPTRCISGREVCRRQLLGGPYIFGTMTSVLVRCDLVRKREKFFNEQLLQADMEACFDVLQESDFGFVHQVLSLSRDREQGTDSFASNLNSQRLADFVVFAKYGLLVLEQDEYRERWADVHRQYHRVLAHNVLRRRPKEFWKYHADTLAAFGCRIDRWLLAKSIFAEAASQFAHPVNALRRVRIWWPSEVRRADGRKAKKYLRPSNKRQADIGEPVVRS